MFSLLLVCGIVECIMGIHGISPQSCRPNTEAEDHRLLVEDVLGCLNFLPDMDGDDRMSFVSKLRLLATKEELRAIYQRRFEGPTPAIPLLTPQIS